MDAKNSAGMDTGRMVNAPPIYLTDPDKAPRSLMDVGKAHLPNPTAPRLDVARLYRLHSTDKVENVPITQTERVRGELRHAHRHGNKMMWRRHGEGRRRKAKTMR